MRRSENSYKTLSSSKIKRKGIIFIVSGPSGSGKTTLCKKLLEQELIKGSLVKTVSVTTRTRRKGEKTNKDYQFITKNEFLRKKTRGQLLESQEVFGFFYGTPKSFVRDNLKKGKDVLLCIDVKGAQAVKKKYPKACGIFVMPPSLQVLRQRLEERSTETKGHMQQRLKIAKWEMVFAKKYDYVILNNRLNVALAQLEAAIIIERARREK
ncbi:MAG: guanylate kinase [Candidatus Omnitrophota bacterium]